MKGTVEGAGPAGGVEAGGAPVKHELPFLINDAGAKKNEMLLISL